MNRTILFFCFCLPLLAIEIASAQVAADYFFPLHVGNYWNYHTPENPSGWGDRTTRETIAGTDLITIKIEFPFFNPDAAMILGDFTNWQEKMMTKISDSIYQYNVDTLTPGNNYTFNAGFKLLPYNDSNYFYISTSCRNLSRILYTRVYINNKLINSSYVWGDNNIYFNINNDGTIEPANNPVNQNIDDRIPPEVYWPFAVIHDSSDVPDANQTQVTGWVQVLHNNNYTESSKIEIDYIKLYARTETQDVLLDSTEYFSFDQINDGGLYMRYPFFPIGYDDPPDPMPATALNGYLTFNPSSIRNKVWHFWNPRWLRAKTLPNYKSYWFEVKYRITGKACIQIGIDYRDSSDNIKEAGVSDWGFDSDGSWQTLIMDTKHQIVPVELNVNFMPKEFALYQNYPNPFNPSTTIQFFIPHTEFVSLKLYDVLGREVATLLSEILPPGVHRTLWKSTDVASGVYFYRLQAGSFSETKKLVLTR